MNWALLWRLLRNDARLRWREMQNSWWFLLVVALALPLGFGFLLRTWLKGAWIGSDIGAVLSTWHVGLGLGMWVLFALMLSHGVQEAVLLLFDRADLDLLRSSPSKTNMVFLAKALGVALNIALAEMVFLGGIPLVLLVLGFPQALGFYPTLLAFALLAAALAVLVTLGLVWALGVQRMRVVTQVLAALFGASVFLALQLPNILRGTTLGGWLFGRSGDFFKDLFVASPLWLVWPGRAVVDVVWSLLLLPLGGLALLAAVQITGAWFVRGLQDGAVVATHGRPAQSPLRLRTNLFGVMLHKEWRLILRAPNVVSKLLLSVLYMVPACVVFFRGEGLGFLRINGGLTSVVGFVVVLSASSLTGILAQLCIWAEEAPDLLQTAPVAKGRVIWAKGLAAVLPAALVTSPLLVFGALNNANMLLILGVWLGVMVATTVLMLCFARPISNKDVFNRARNSNFLLGVLQFLVTGSWMVVVVASFFAWPWLLLALGVALGLPGLALWSWTTRVYA